MFQLAKTACLGKRSLNRYLLVFSLTLSIAPSFSLILPEASRVGAQEGKPVWQQEWEETVRRADMEAALSLNLSSSGDFEKVVQVFQKKYPKIRVVPVVSGLHVATRILAEKRAEKYLADVVVTGPGTPYYVLHKAKALDPIKSAFVLPEVVDESRWWQGKHHFVDSEGKYVFVFIGPVSRGSVYYNTKLVSAVEFKSYWDLLNPRWRGKLLLVDPRAPGAARLGLREIFHMPELGTKFLRRLFGEMELTLTRDVRQAADWLAVGRFPICLFCSEARDAKAQGLPVDEFKTNQWLETPTISPGGTSTLVLVNRAPHPNAAKIFINWLLSREGQDTFQKIMNRPDNLFESMRIDIPKDPIPLEYRRKEGINYLMMATPERADHAPVEKLLNEILK